MSFARFKFVAALSITAVLVGLVTGVATAQSVNLRVQTAGANQATMDEIASRFEAENPDVDVQVTSSALEQYQVALLTQLAANNGPDVMYVLPGGANPISVRPLAAAGNLLDLSDEPWVSRIPAGFKADTEYEGKTVIYPTGQAMIGVLYNQDVFDANGISLPATYDELLQTCEAFNEAGIIPIVQGNLTPWVPQLVTYNIVPSTVYAENPDFNTEQAAGETSFAASEGWQEAFTKIQELIDRGCFNENTNGTTIDQMVESLGTGDAAMTFMLTAAMSRIAPYVEEGVNIGMMPFPAVNDPANIYALAFPLNSYGVYGKTEHPEEAKAFVEFMTRPEIIQLFVDASRDIPILTTEGIDIDPILDNMLQAVAEGRSASSPDQAWPNTFVQQEHIAVVQEFFAGTTTADEALERMDKAYNEE